MFLSFCWTFSVLAAVCSSSSKLGKSWCGGKSWEMGRQPAHTLTKPKGNNINVSTRIYVYRNWTTFKSSFSILLLFYSNVWVCPVRVCLCGSGSKCFTVSPVGISFRFSFFFSCVPHCCHTALAHIPKTESRVSHAGAQGLQFYLPWTGLMAIPCWP